MDEGGITVKNVVGVDILMDNPFIIVDSAFLSKVLEVIVFITKIIYSI